MPELGNYCKRLPHPRNAFSNLFDLVLIDVSEENCSATKIVNPLWNETHHARAGRVYSDGIITHDENAALPRLPLRRPVSFHAHNSVDNGEIGSHRAVQVQN